MFLLIDTNNPWLNKSKKELCNSDLSVFLVLEIRHIIHRRPVFQMSSSLWKPVCLFWRHIQWHSPKQSHLMMSHSWSGTIKRVVFCCGEVAEQVLMAQAIIKLLNPLPCRRHLLIERRMQPERYQRDIPCTNCSILHKIAKSKKVWPKFLRACMREKSPPHWPPFC